MFGYEREEIKIMANKLIIRLLIEILRLLMESKIRDTGTRYEFKSENDLIIESQAFVNYSI